MNETQAKAEIDTLIRNARFRCFRPIRVAEILYRSRTDSQIDIENPESYRVKSANWRDDVSRRLTGKGSTSSRSYQKDFSDLIQPTALKILDEINRDTDGIVEGYIYYRLKNDKWDGLISAHDYVHSIDMADFKFDDFMSLTNESGLEDDALLEIAAFALFKGITRELDATATLQLKNPDRTLLHEYQDFIEIFLGLSPDQTSFETPVSIYRAGKGAYAADKGIDIGTNFGTMVQVKHISLTEDQAKTIDSRAYVDSVVVVCRDSEKAVVERVANQLGYEKLRAIVTMSDLSTWFDISFNSHTEQIGSKILQALKREFNEEFTSGESTVPTGVRKLIEERGYDQLTFEGIWAIDGGNSSGR